MAAPTMCKKPKGNAEKNLKSKSIRMDAVAKLMSNLQGDVK